MESKISDNSRIKKNYYKLLHSYPYIHKTFLIFFFIRIHRDTESNQNYRAITPRALCMLPPIPVDESNWQKRCSNASLFWTNGQRRLIIGRTLYRPFPRWRTFDSCTLVHRKTDYYPNHRRYLAPSCRFS